MAERRMFAKTIIDSDAFLDMPLSAQALYFHLSMRADDEGFINNPKKIKRTVGASDDDIKLLITKNFIIPFENGVVVIKHWRIHNYIRADRLVSTKYQDERMQLDIKENGAYTLINGVQECDNLESDDRRKLAYKNSSLPYSFIYKIRRAFDGHLCPVCGCKMSTTSPFRKPTIQHNIPISKGGEHELGNISVICLSCNTSIRDTETGELNNAEVVEMWDKITIADKLKLNWFWDVSLLDEIDVSQVTDICQADVSIGKDSIGKDSIGKVSEGECKNKINTYPHITLTESELSSLKSEMNDYCDGMPSWKFYLGYMNEQGKKRNKTYTAADVLDWYKQDKTTGRRAFTRPSGYDLDKWKADAIAGEPKYKGEKK